MKTTNLDAKTARNIELKKVLSKMGYKPKKSTDTELWYISPFRDEKTPSFKLDTTINKWFDFGEGKGGNTLDFVIHKLGCSVKEALLFLTDYNSFSFQPPLESISNSTNNIKIISVGEIKHPALIEYLEERKICLEVAQVYCKEVHYSIRGKEYFALGLANASDGYSLRNKYFKGISKQGITCFFVRNSFMTDLLSSKIWIFEGMFDLLSQAQIMYNYGGCYPFIYDDFIVLNSVTNYKQARDFIMSYDESKRVIWVCVDNDLAGRDILKKLKKDFKHMDVHDSSDRYKKYKDLNEFLVAGS